MILSVILGKSLLPAVCISILLRSQVVWDKGCLMCSNNIQHSRSQVLVPLVANIVKTANEDELQDGSLEVMRLSKEKA